MRKKIATVVLALATLSSVFVTQPAEASRPFNVYNNSDHGMWFITGNWLTGPYQWVPAKMWSRDVGVLAVGVYTGSGYCTRVFMPANGGWFQLTDVRGAKRISTPNIREWMVEERLCP